jgi:hypothetical protein
VVKTQGFYKKLGDFFGNITPKMVRSFFYVEYGSQLFSATRFWGFPNIVREKPPTPQNCDTICGISQAFFRVFYGYRV